MRAWKHRLVDLQKCYGDWNRVRKILDEVGAEGWELVNVATEWNHPSVAVFKMVTEACDPNSGRL